MRVRATTAKKDHAEDNRRHDRGDDEGAGGRKEGHKDSDDSRSGQDNRERILQRKEAIGFSHIMGGLFPFYAGVVLGLSSYEPSLLAKILSIGGFAMMLVGSFLMVPVPSRPRPRRGVEGE